MIQQNYRPTFSPSVQAGDTTIKLVKKVIIFGGYSLLLDWSFGALCLWYSGAVLSEGRFLEIWMTPIRQLTLYQSSKVLPRYVRQLLVY